MSKDPNKAYTEAQNENRPFQSAKAGMACWGIHIGLTIILTLALIAIGVTDLLPIIVGPYMFAGWIPLTIWLRPFLQRHMK